MDCYLTIDNVGNIGLNTKEIIIPWYENRFLVNDAIVGANLYVGSTYVNEAAPNLGENSGYQVVSPRFRLFYNKNKMHIVPNVVFNSVPGCFKNLGFSSTEFECNFLGNNNGSYSKNIFLDIGKDSGDECLVFSPSAISNKENIENQEEVLNVNVSTGTVFDRIQVLNQVLGIADDDVTKLCNSYFPFAPFTDLKSINPNYIDSSDVKDIQVSVLKSVKELLSTGGISLFSPAVIGLTEIVYSGFFLKGLSKALFYSPDIKELPLFDVMRNFVITIAIGVLLIIILLQFIAVMRGKITIREIVKGLALTILCVFLPITILPWTFTTVFNGTTNFILDREINAALISDIQFMAKYNSMSDSNKLENQETINASQSSLKYGDLEVPLLAMIPWDYPEGKTSPDLVNMLEENIDDLGIEDFNKYTSLYKNDMMSSIKEHYKEVVEEEGGADPRFSQKIGFLDKYTPQMTKSQAVSRSKQNKSFRYIDHYYNSLGIDDLIASSETWYDTYYLGNNSSPEDVPFTYEGDSIPKNDMCRFLGSLEYVTSESMSERGWKAGYTGSLTEDQQGKLIDFVECVSDKVAEQATKQFGNKGYNYLGSSSFEETYLDSLTVYTYLAIMQATSDLVDNKTEFLNSVPTKVTINSIDTDVFVRALVMPRAKLVTTSSKNTTVFVNEQGLIQGIAFFVLVLFLILYAIFNLIAKFALIILAIPVFFVGYVIYKDFNNKAWLGFMYTIVIVYGIHVSFLVLYKLCVMITNL